MALVSVLAVADKANLLPLSGDKAAARAVGSAEVAVLGRVGLKRAAPAPQRRNHHAQRCWAAAGCRLHRVLVVVQVPADGASVAPLADKNIPAAPAAGTAEVAMLALVGMEWAIEVDRGAPTLPADATGGLKSAALHYMSLEKSMLSPKDGAKIVPLFREQVPAAQTVATAEAAMLGLVGTKSATSSDLGASIRPADAASILNLAVPHHMSLEKSNCRKRSRPGTALQFPVLSHSVGADFARMCAIGLQPRPPLDDAASSGCLKLCYHLPSAVAWSLAWGDGP